MQLAHYGARVWTIMQVHIISLERLHKSLCHAITLGTVVRGAAYFKINISGKLNRLSGQVIQPVVAQPFNGILRSIYRAKAILQRLYHQVPHILCIDPSRGSDIAEHLTVTAVKTEDNPNDFLAPAGNFKDISAPAQVAPYGDDLTRMSSAMELAGGALKKQVVALHDPIDPFMVHQRQIVPTALSVQDGMNATVPIGRSPINNLLDVREQHQVSSLFIRLAPRLLLTGTLIDVGTGDFKCFRDAFHRMSSLGSKGTRDISFFPGQSQQHL